MMARLSTRSNPTGLKELDRGRVSLTLAETAGRRIVILDRLDLSDSGLTDSLKVVLVARAGATSIRHGLGSVAGYSKEGNSLDGLDPSQPIRFRILLHEDGNPRLVASVENLRARDDSESESLLPMEPADLGERVWKLAITEDGPILQFNSRVFPSASGAENFVAFGAMVLPEALRQVMEKIAEDPSCLDDESDPLNAWGAWLDAHGVDRPQADDNTSKEAWCDQVVDRFCNRCSFASRLLTELQKEGGQ
jgi:hypothetical protein